MSDHRNIPSFFQTGFDSPITEVAIMLVSEKDGKYLCLGSGVIIGHFIAMTARHVVDGFSQEHEGKAIERLGGEGTFSLRAIQFLENGSKALAWDVRHIYLNNDAGFTDIVFLRLQPTHQVHLDYRWKKVRMRLMPPRIGSIISGFGYHSTEAEVSEGMVALNTNPVTTTGIVEEIHHERRDYSRLSFPCFRTDARFDRGSGFSRCFR